MRVTLNTKKLTREAIKAIESGQVEKYELQKLRQNVIDYIEPVKKRFTMASVLLITMFVLMSASSVMNLQKNGAFDPVTVLTVFAPVILFLVVVFALLGWVSFGRIKGQFNKALRKGYPDLYEEYKV